LLRLGEILASDEGEYIGSMAVGPWLAVDGRTPAGALAVLVDDRLGNDGGEHVARART
jgi:hypothetical protein